MLRLQVCRGRRPARQLPRNADPPVNSPGTLLQRRLQQAEDARPTRQDEWHRRTQHPAHRRVTVRWHDALAPLRRTRCLRQPAVIPGPLSLGHRRSTRGVGGRLSRARFATSFSRSSSITFDSAGWLQPIEEMTRSQPVTKQSAREVAAVGVGGEPSDEYGQTAAPAGQTPVWVACCGAGVQVIQRGRPRGSAALNA